MSATFRKFKSGNIKPLFEKFRYFPLASPERYGNSYLKNAIAEIPEVLVSGYLCVCAIASIALAWQVGKRTEYFANPPHKRFYTVMRPDDPRVKDIRTEYFRRIDTADECRIRMAPKTN